LEKSGMATMYLAMWLQESDAANNRHLIFILILIIAVAIAGMAVVLVVFSLKALKAVKEITATADELKYKLMPLLDEATILARSGREILLDAAPKLKLISENLVKTSDTLAETSRVARGAMQKIEATVSDANLRTQRQVARVDGMVTATLNTTAEIVENINHGIRVPAQKIAAAATQAKYIAEGLLAKFRSMAAATPFGRKSRVDPEPPPPTY
jgi:methyl-accepting chemotaxis protein